MNLVVCKRACPMEIPVIFKISFVFFGSSQIKKKSPSDYGSEKTN